MDLSQEVTAVKDIGEKTAAKLKKAGIYTLHDLLYFLPRDYENFQSAVKISELRPGKIVVRGKISDLKTTAAKRRGLSITSGTISDGTGSLRVVWFNQPYRVKQFDCNRDYYFTGQYSLQNGRYQLVSPSAALAKDKENIGDSDLQPIYPAKSGIPSLKFHQFFENMRSDFAFIPDILPGATLDDPVVTDDSPGVVNDASEAAESTSASKMQDTSPLDGAVAQLPLTDITASKPDFVFPGARADALFKVHFPENSEEIVEASRYLAYEELFELLLAANLSKQENHKLRAEPMPFDAKIVQKLVKSLPFKLTDAQRKATWDILQDLEKKTPMNRLLQGDVGSGKTVVAAIAAFQAIANGFQVALLAPTAILALQHAESLDALLRPLGVNIALLIGSTKRKNLVKQQIAQGNANLIIGTHALITDDTIFHHLGLCIIDEQHRFGVNQRQKLLSKTAHNVIKPDDEVPYAPHLLSMTATPIPRSLQLTVFGDLDVSVINQLPEGRQPITTTILKETDQKEKLYPIIREEVKNKHQIYWICRSIEERRGSGSTLSVKKQATRLKSIFPELKIEYLHGRMKPDEKDAIMNAFAAGKIDLLVSTTVVEVGVNVPNATTIVISDAEYYGLAQLHQLRGRVGRGVAKSSCYLISGNDNPTTRLKAMEKSTDGFYLAEMDLKIRGPGEIYGSLQHGALNLQIATLTDTVLISQASRQAKAVASEFDKNPENMVKYKELMQEIAHYQQLTTLN